MKITTTLTLMLCALTSTMSFAELCTTQLVRPNGDKLATFYGEGANREAACAKATASCNKMHEAAMVEASDWRVYDAECKVLPKEPEVGPIVIPMPQIIKKTASFELECETSFGDFRKTCFLHDADNYPTNEFANPGLPNDYYDLKMLKIEKISDNGRCDGRWTVGTYGGEISSVEIKGGCDAKFKITYSYKYID